MIRTPVSAGELLDKVSILEIKCDRIIDPAKVDNCRRELKFLIDVIPAIGVQHAKVVADGIRDLKEVNSKLWTVEDDLRKLERLQDFGDEFVRLARSVYQINDERAAIKRRINVTVGSELIEEKQHPHYGAA